MDAGLPLHDHKGWCGVIVFEIKPGNLFLFLDRLLLETTNNWDQIIQWVGWGNKRGAAEECKRGKFLVRSAVEQEADIKWRSFQLGGFLLIIITPPSTHMGKNSKGL